MERVSRIYKFYKLGSLISKSKTKPYEVSNVDYYNHITYIIDTIYDMGLSILKAQIFSKLKDTQGYFKKISATKPKDNVSESKFLIAEDAIKEIEQILKPELLKMVSYIPPNLKLNINKLYNFPHSFFNKDLLLRIKLDDYQPIMFNIFEFGKCYAFSLFTAASTHIVKATEEYNRYFYKILKKNDLLKECDDKKIYDNILNETKKLILKNNKNEDLIKSLHKINLDLKKEKKRFKNLLLKCEKDKTWNDIIKETKDLIPVNSENKKLISSLHKIKNEYRNEIQHSNKQLFEDDASKLFNLCKKVINEMDRILELR